MTTLREEMKAGWVFRGWKRCIESLAWFSNIYQNPELLEPSE